MGRQWEAHDDNGLCDHCGEIGFVWDIYGDLICPRCAEQSAKEYDGTENKE
jgi:hypothetical protein